jgi:hypothetical protein
MTTATAPARLSTEVENLTRFMLVNRVVPVAARDRLMARLDSRQVTEEQAKEAIAWLQRQSPVDVPAGRYAVATEAGATNTLAFYKVDRPAKGKWVGKVFVRLMVSDEEQRLSWATTQAVLAKIAADPEAAAAAFGQKIGKCGVCGRTLTADESRDRAIGPKCLAKLGW